MARNQSQRQRKIEEANKRLNDKLFGPGSKVEDLKSKPDSYVECRAYRFHAWALDGYYRWRHQGNRGVCRVSTCMRCGMGREDFYNPDGSLYYRGYNRPEGYELQGTGDVTMYDAQRELQRRHTVYANISAMSDQAPRSIPPLSLVRSS